MNWQYGFYSNSVVVHYFTAQSKAIHHSNHSHCRLSTGQVLVPWGQRKEDSLYNTCMLMVILAGTSQS